MNGTVVTKAQRHQWETLLRIRIRDGKKSKSGSGMNIPDNISESLETIFWLKYLNSLMRMRIQIQDPGIFLTLVPG